MKNKKSKIFEFIYKKKLKPIFNSKNQNKNNLSLFLFSSQNIFKLTSRLLRFECRFENLWVVLNKSHYPNFSWHFQEGQIAQLISIFNSSSKIFEFFSRFSFAGAEQCIDDSKKWSLKLKVERHGKNSS